MPANGGIRSKVDRAGKEPLKSADELTVVRSVLWQVEFFKDLGRGTEDNSPALLPDSKSGDPDWDQAVLPERQAVLRMPGHLKAEPPVPASVLQCTGRRSVDGQPTLTC